MSFVTDFTSIAGTVGDTFKNVWSSVNAPTRISLPATVTQPAGSGVGSALQNAAKPSVSTQTILLGAAGIILAVVVILMAFGKGGRRR